MDPQRARQLLGILVVILIGVVILVAMLTSCTLVIIRGNDDTLGDIGGHESRLTLDGPQQPASSGPRLKRQR
jgi:hypothetical protein